ncbi:MAG TPA: NADH:flavin oxidoreductase [Dehalococcoidia bacterium]|nr:NADH:flavin oxidoreductase [Dehalococcoidia bacterium]
MAINVFEPYVFGEMVLKNRFVRSATWDATADDDGFVTDTSVELYRKLGQGHIGLIVSGYAFVSPSGKAAVRQYGVHSDDMIPGLKRLVEAVHQGGSKIALQIVHAGSQVNFLPQQSDTEYLAVSKRSDIQIKHREMNDEEIQEIISDFAKAALRGKEAGFDAVQLHGCHGYLMSQMHSPLLNHRMDKWGGSPENRRNFYLEVIREVRKLVGDNFPLMIKYGIKDESESGLSLNEGLETISQLVDAGIDLVEVSANVGGSLINADNTVERPYFREWTAAVKKTVNVPVVMVGGIRSVGMSQDIVNGGDADLVAMCRPFIREPDLITRWERGDTSPAKCVSCFKCLGVTIRGKPIECAEENPQL